MNVENAIERKTKMIDNKPFAMFFNASPRKNWNTYKMLEAAKAGAEEAGAVTELVNLYDIKFSGASASLMLRRIRGS